jgi:hypothetical protein
METIVSPSVDSGTLPPRAGINRGHDESQAGSRERGRSLQQVAFAREVGPCR